MKEAHPPEGFDNELVTLHHITQAPDGPLVELSYTSHAKDFRKILHDNVGQDKSKIFRPDFDKERKQWWILRAKDF